MTHQLTESRTLPDAARRVTADTVESQTLPDAARRVTADTVESQTLPDAERRVTADTVKSQTLPDGAPRYRHVLLVEDEHPLRTVIARNLTSRGIHVREAAAAENALQALRESIPDLLLLDINLPDRTGWDVLRDMARQHIEVPTVVVSAVRVSQTRLDEFKPIAYLPKPFPIDALLRLVLEGARAAR
jgi:CheY-like chemotaxis protein